MGGKVEAWLDKCTMRRRVHARSDYLKARRVSESREMSSSNWTSFTPSCSTSDVNTPYNVLSVVGPEYATEADFTSSDSMVLHPPAAPSSAMAFGVKCSKVR